MSHLVSDKKTSWDVFIIAGASGTGKTSVSYRLARYFDVGITEIDDLHTVLETLTTPEQQPELHYWRTKPDSVQMTAEDVLGLHLSVSKIMEPALKAVIKNHIEEGTPIVLEGDYILPELLTQEKDSSWTKNRVWAVFLYEPDEQQIVKNLLVREPDEGEQIGRAHVSKLYGDWLKDECLKHGLPVIPARPWETLLERILEVSKLGYLDI